MEDILLDPLIKIIRNRTHKHTLCQGGTKRIATEKTVEDLKKLFKESKIQPVGLTDFEESMLYFIMQSNLERRHFGCFGIDEGFYLVSLRK